MKVRQSEERSEERSDSKLPIENFQLIATLLALAHTAFLHTNNLLFFASFFAVSDRLQEVAGPPGTTIRTRVDRGEVLIIPFQYEQAVNFLTGDFYLGADVCHVEDGASKMTPEARARTWTQKAMKMTTMSKRKTENKNADRTSLPAQL